MIDCLFCKIVSGEIPATKIYEDENFLAFLDVNPVNQGHSLVIPKKHSRNILDIDDDILKTMMPVVKKLSQKIKTSLNADGINIIINNEPAAGQVIFHTHVHIIPRFDSDGLKHWSGEKYEEGEAEIIARKIKSA